MKKYTFIGTGVANVFCVLDMLQNGIRGEDILMIDSGKNPYDRDEKDIMQGFLGAGGRSDFKVVYSLTRGGELVKYVGEEKANELIKRVKTIIREFHPNPELIKISGKEEIESNLKNNIEKYFNILQSESEHIGTDYAKLIGKNMFDYMKKENVNFRFNTTIDEVFLEDNKIETLNEMFLYDELIIGTGKNGMDFLNRMIKKYKIETTDSNIQIGVRFESQQKYFDELLKTFYDFKLQQTKGDVSIRSFCVNSGAAFVTEEDNNGLISYNGHAYVNKEKNGMINFGIMMEIPDKNPLFTTQNFVRMNNENGSGFFYSKNNDPTIPGLNVVRNKSDIKGKYINNVWEFIEDLDKVFNFNYNYGFYVPEVKYLTKTIKLEKESMSLLNNKNVHVIGDAASARGIFVSSSHGLYLSDYFGEKL